MDFSTLPMGSIILADDYLHPMIRKAMAASKQGSLGIRITDISAFLTSYYYKKAPSRYQVLFTIYQQVQQLDKKDFPTYRNILCSKDFLEECYQLLNELSFWGIDSSSLPKQSASQKELFTILQLFKDVVFPKQLLRLACEQIKKKDLSNVYIIDTYNDIAKNQIIKQFLQQGAKLSSFPKEEQEIAFYHAVNKRQEIEACAQHILNHSLDAQDIHITLCDASYPKLIEQIFQRYHIPYTLFQQETSSQLPKQFLALLNYVFDPCKEQLLTCLDSELFTGGNIHALREYMQLFEVDLFDNFHHLETMEDSGNLMNIYTLKQLQELENKAAEAQAELLPFFTQLNQNIQITNKVELIVNELNKHIHTDEDRSIYRKITTILYEIGDVVQTKNDLHFLASFFENIQGSKKQPSYQGVLIHNHKQEVLPRKYHYVLGATQTNYPAFQTKKGIFDEAYYALIKGYPSMEERYAHYMEQMNQILTHSKYLILSYPVGSYEGKSMEAALEIEQYAQKPSQPYPLHENYAELRLQDTLSADMAKQLFLKNGCLHGSISSFERYVKCPFSYFLRYGLSLKEPFQPGFPDAYAGTLFHYILESLTNAYGKEYSEQSSKQLRKIVDKELAHLTQIFPSMELALMNVKERLLISMTQTLEVLQEFETHSQFSPTASELEFHYDLPLQENVTIALHGFIDRLDTYQDFACILDYKSSIKTLSETDIFAALQLQLLTYAMVVHQQQQKEIMGAYYISLKNETIPCPAGKLTRKKPVTYNEYVKEDYMLMKQKAQRFNGWTMQKQVDTLDDNATHIVGLRINKEEEVKAGKLYNLEAISSYMKQLYEILASRILNGDIACTPLEHACDYCSYQPICRFKGFYADKKRLVEPHDDLYWDGGEQDA